MIATGFMQRLTCPAISWRRCRWQSEAGGVLFLKFRAETFQQGQFDLVLLSLAGALLL